MIRLVTLLVVVAGPSSGGGGVVGDASSTGDTRPAKDVPALLPKLSFHFEGFLVTGAGGGGGGEKFERVEDKSADGTVGSLVDR
jgi:hypothetical protein